MSKETQLRIINAFRAMKAIGIKEDKVKPALKSLLKLYDRNWALIEDDNYRALADAILERDEKEEEQQPKKNVDNKKQDQLEQEAERLPKRLKSAGQTSSLNTCNTSMPTSATHSTKINGAPAISQSIARTEGKQPSSSNSLLHENNHTSHRSIISISQQTPQSTIELKSPSHPMRLRERGVTAASPQIPSKAKRSVNTSSSNGVQFKEPKVEPAMLSTEKKKTATPAIIKPKDEPITNDTDTSNGDDSTNRNSMLREYCTPETPTLQYVGERNAADIETSQGECFSTLDIASSSSGEVKISLCYELARRRPDFHIPSLETVLKFVKNKYISSSITSNPSISVMDVIKEVCECFLELGTNLNKQSVNTDATKSSAAEGRFSKDSSLRSLNGLVYSRSPKSKVLSPPLNGVNHGAQLDNKLDDEDEIAITRENQGNRDDKMDDVVDIARGQEKFAITLVNEVNNERPPSFCYIRQNAIFQNAYANFSLARIVDNNCCANCSGDCLSLSVPCACSHEMGGEFAYTADGLVKEELLNECISMNRDPKKHRQYICQECPLERSKSEDIIEPCKGHLVRKFIKECWIKCGCNMQCGNRVVQRGISRKLQVFMTPGGKGWGLRTLEDLPKGAFVCEYVGEVLTNAELFERVLGSREGDKHSYPVLLDADWCAEGVLKDEEALCLDATYYGNVARFINHKCYDSNLVEIPVEVETADHHYYHLAFFTTRKVKAMEELTWDYGIDFDDHEHPIKAFRCQCGSKFCRDIKRSNTKRSRSRARRW